MPPDERIIDEKPEPYETVDHPKHYNRHPSGVVCIQVVEEMSFNIGTAIKHLWRVGEKPGVDPLEDLNKARWYTEREIERLTRSDLRTRRTGA